MQIHLDTSGTQRKQRYLSIFRKFKIVFACFISSYFPISKLNLCDINKNKTDKNKHEKVSN